MATTAPEIATSPIADGGLSMGHLALHYGKPEDGPLASRLLQIAGLKETQVLPLPGGNFYRFVVSGNHFARGDGIEPVDQGQVLRPVFRVEARHGAAQVLFGQGIDIAHTVRQHPASDR